MLAAANLGVVLLALAMLWALWVLREAAAEDQESEDPERWRP